MEKISNSVIKAKPPKMGKVVSNAMQSTIVVVSTTKKQHPLYKKFVTKSKKFYVHCEQNVEVNSIVKFVETRPLSKLKRWKLLEVVGGNNSELGDDTV